MHARLKDDEIKTDLDPLFAGTETVDEPQDTIAKLIASELTGVNHVDIRPPGADPIPDGDERLIAERDSAMAKRVMEVLGSATSVLVICGERHKLGLSRNIEGHGLRVESLSFPK